MPLRVNYSRSESPCSRRVLVELLSFCRQHQRHQRIAPTRNTITVHLHGLRKPRPPSMNARFLRPFARAAFRAPTAVRPSTVARPALIASQNKKTEVGPQQMMVLKSAMPQLIPFFFVNETTVAFILLPSLIYVFSKYILPQRVRLFAARLFISKL
ncbi:fungal ATP synthase protein 8-domain-containing protein [Paraphoma chrysanthemicola]|nr:fungal ATP synthase protein 8-domain-containing protein [Paraphoma chrysanthemicola]